MGVLDGLSPASLLVLALILVCLIAYGTWRAGEVWANLRQPTVTRDARVLGKHVREDRGTGWEPGTTYLATFLLEDGQQIEYPVTEAEYAHLAVGQCGRLSHRGAWYRGFHPLAA
jgi:hypothetical protein